ncbi:phosphoglycerate dehydrogenase [Pirellulaceae bacterium]|jgi:D-3-phosphoglycerate dehydrogenase / 2-oxoglutarate reductase|nr:phosphoglycerate dehydrogenase [Pirellulaceae bacterium]
MVRISLDKEKIRILLLEGIHQTAVDVFENAGYRNIDYVTTALPENELIQRAKGAHFIGIRSRSQLTPAVLKACPKLMAIGCFCIGTNQIDLDATQEMGICVFNAPYSNTRSVAELVVSEASLLLRKIPEKNAACHQGEWLKSSTGSFELRGKTLGIVGYGAIGSQVSVLAESWGMNVIFHDTVTKLPLGNAAQVSSLSQLLSQSHIVSLHVPETLQTQNLISKKQLQEMRPGSILLNASRGTVVDIDALAESIENGHLGGAAIDVFPAEPKGDLDEFVSPLRGLPNVILTPHVGGSTEEAQANIGMEVAEKLVRYSDNGTTTSSVNFPEVALPQHSRLHRLLHVHQNVPGVLASINKVFSEFGINVSGQYLRTNENLGYVVLDIESNYNDEAIKTLKQIPGTIRCRVLF